MMRIAGLLLVAAMFVLASPGHALGRQSLDEVEAVNTRKLEVEWVVVRPGDQERSGFALSKDGQLSRAGQPFTPKVEVTDEQGATRSDVDEVRIAPPSPSGRWSFMTACEPVTSGEPLCWFQYLLDLDKKRLLDLAWAKYPQPVPLYWHAGERYVVIPTSGEGELWLVVVDIEKRTAVDIHFELPVLEAARSVGCRGEEVPFALDLESLAWSSDGQVDVVVYFNCSQEGQPRRLIARLDPATGKLKTVADRVGKAGVATGDAALRPPVMP